MIKRRPAFWRRIGQTLIHSRANRNIKDVLFRYIFKDKEALLMLYNALNGSNYTNPKELQIVTYENAIWMSVKCDIAFVVENVMNLYEHQSTINLNMPIRGLLYFTQQYENMILAQNANIYGKKVIKLPTPNFVIFYNGAEDAPERSELCLSDAFEKQMERPAVEVVATMININFRHNMELLDACKPLYDYSFFINKIREYENQGSGFSEAVDQAADYCIDHEVMTDILSIHRGEVKKMLLTEYNPRKHLKLEREEARKEGREEGVEL